MGIPFISFTYAHAPRLAQAALERPQVFLHYKLFADSWNHLAASQAGITPQELDQIEKTYPQTVPSALMVMPWRTSTGHPWVADLSPFAPGLKELNPMGVNLGLPGETMVNNTVMQNPIAQLSAILATGQNTQTHAQMFPVESPLAQPGANILGLPPDMQHMLFDETRSAGNTGRLAAAARTILPEMAGGGATQNLIRALTQQPAFSGEPISPLRAAVQTVGPNLQDVGQQQMMELLALRGQAKKARGQAMRNAR